jgi:hypothetical protein
METATILGLAKDGTVVRSTEKNIFQLPWQLERGSRFTTCVIQCNLITFSQANNITRVNRGLLLFLSMWLVLSIGVSWWFVFASLLIGLILLIENFRTKTDTVPFELSISHPEAAHADRANCPVRKIERLVVRENCCRDVCEDGRLSQLLVRFAGESEYELVYQLHFTKANLVLELAAEIMEWYRCEPADRESVQWDANGRRTRL